MMECESVLIAWRPNRVNENKKKKTTLSEATSTATSKIVAKISL